MSVPVIKLDNVTKTYGSDYAKVDALRGVNLTIQKKEFVSIMGASGSGKSTLLHLIGVLDIPTKGKIYLSGSDISTLSKERLSRMRGEEIGFVFQFFNLYPTLNVKENVELPMLIHETKKKIREERSKDLLKDVGLSHRMEHYPSQLSGGEKQRVAIARALANDPNMILADEPTGNLDSTSSREIMNIFRNLNDNGKTIVMVTHEKDIARYSKRIIHVKDGKIIRDGGNK